MDKQTPVQIHIDIQRGGQAAQSAQGRRMLYEIPFVFAVQSWQTCDRMRIVSPEAQRTTLFDNNQTEEEEEEGQTVA